MALRAVGAFRERARARDLDAPGVLFERRAGAKRFRREHRKTRAMLRIAHRAVTDQCHIRLARITRERLRRRVVVRVFPLRVTRDEWRRRERPHAARDMRAQRGVRDGGQVRRRRRVEQELDAPVGDFGERGGEPGRAVPDAGIADATKP